MQSKVGLAQIPNTTDLQKNFNSIMLLLSKFERANVDLVLFPECSLSGFSAKMRESTMEQLSPYFSNIQEWVNRTNIDVVLPTAIADSGRVYNTGRWFKRSESIAFYKVGLTESEKKFFSVPENEYPKRFEVKGFRFAVLLCFEAEHAPWTYFNEGEVDAILWPGYWGWDQSSTWGPEKEPGRLNPIYANMEQWQVPLLQSNFALNALEGYAGDGPEGLSFVVGSDNKLAHRGPHKQAGGVIVSLKKHDGSTFIESCETLQ